MAIRSNKPLIVLLTLLLIGAIGAAIWWAVQLRRPLEARQNPTVSVELPAEGIVSRNSNFEFVFDQKMDHAAVEQALSVVPDFAHTVEWREEGDGERLVIRPAEALQWETTYRASLSIEALNEEGRPLERQAEASFTTTSEIRVLEVFPSVNTEMVGLDEAITIRFDQPVPDADREPVEAQDERQEGLPQPLILDPSTPGIGQWLDDDLYAFYPANPLNAGTEYQVLINSMVAPGVELPEAYRWSFVTEPPEVQVSFPFDGAIEVSRSTDVRLQFAQPMNEESVQESFQLSVQGQEQSVTGDFVWEDQQTLLFKPAEALAVATDYQINVTDQATTPGGARGLGAPYRAVFTTVDYLAVESVQPAPGTVEVSLAPTNTLIAVQFNRPVVSLVGLADKEELPTPITIEPAMSGEGEWVTTSLFVYRPTQQLAGSSEYVVTVRDDVVDTVASTLQEPYAWTFTTEWPRVLYVEPRARSISDQDPFNKEQNQEQSPAPPPPTLISPNGPVGLRFNQAMDQASSEAAFALRAVDGAPVAGRVEWQDDGTLLHFYPNTPLTRDAPYRLVLQPGAQGATGGQINEPFEADVVVAPQLRVINSDPANGAQDVPPQSSLFIAFNAPIEPQNVKQYIDIEPEVKDFFASYNNEVAELYLSLGRGSTPNTSYTITIDGALPDPHGGTLGQNYVLSFTTGALSPRLRLASGPVGPIGTLNPAVEPVQLVDYRNISQLDFALYRLSEAEMQTLYNKPAWQDYAGNPAALVAEWSLTQEEGLPAEANESTLTQATLPLDAEQRSGLYFLRVTTPDSPDDYPLEDKTILLFAPLNLTVKQTPDEIVVWATDMASGSPRADVEIKIIDEESNATVASGRTDGEGLYRYALPFGDQPNGTRSFLVKSYQPDGTINGIAAPNWSGDASPWAFGYGMEQAPPQLYGTLYTERPIYRPGHTIYYKGALRQREGRALLLPTFPALNSNTDTIEVALQYQGEVLDAQEVTLSPFGTFNGAFQLSEDAPTGYYNLLLQQEEIGYCVPNYCFWEQLNADFQVAEYEPPTFEVTVDTNAEALIQGEAATAGVLANYYSGGGLADAPLRWNQFSRDYYFDVPALAGYWNWQDSEGPGQNRGGGGGPFSPSEPDPLAKNGTSTLDAAGSTTIPLDTDLSLETEEDAQPAAPRSRRLIIEAIVTDLDESLIAGRSEMIVHAGEFYIGLRPESYLGRVGTPFTWDIATADTTGALDGNREVTLEFYQREWTSEVAAFGWTRTFTDTLIATEGVTTDQNGRATVEFTPPAGGSYTVLAIGQDSRGNQVRSRGYFWVTDRSGSVLWGVTNDSKLELTADKQEYQVGDVARILIPTNVEGMTALISEELFAIKEISVRTLESTAEVIEIPITEEMIPNVYINVVAVSGTSSERPAPEFRMGYVKLAVSTAPKALNLQITPVSPPELEGQENEGGPQLQPGQTITFNVQIRDAAGQPVVGELSLAMVDKAVLALAEDRQTSLMDAFYSQRPLSVQTGSSYTINLDRVNETFTAEARGLGGGGGGGGGAPDQVRNEILDTAYWKADLVTDANGEAQVTITLPDNLTTWTIIAKALTADGPLVGEYKSDLLSTKPLIVRPNLPRFFVVGDEADVPVVIHNNSQQAFEALVTFEATGLNLRDGASTNSNNEGNQGTQSVLLAPNSRQVVTFPVQVPPATSNVGSPERSEGSSALVTVRVEGGGLSDALEQRLPIYNLSSPEVVGTSGVMRPDQEATIENIQLPEEIDPTQGDLTIELAPSLAGATEATLDWLEGYPYESVEAVASRLLANSASLQALQLLEQKTPADGERQALQNALQEQIAAGVSKLLEWQNDNGGWGWWASNSSEDSTPWLTAYTLLALYEAELAGAEVAHDPLPAAIPYLQEWLNNTTALQGDTQLDTHAFVLYVLSEINHIAPDLLANAGLQQIAQALFKMQTPLSYGNDGRAFLMMALHNTESPSEMVQAIAAELTGRTRLSATGTHWEEEEPELLTFDSGLRSTALVLRALARIPLPPDASHSDRAYTLMPQTVRWLMNARQNGHWESTQESAWAILALTDYMQISGELDANFDYQIALNQEVIFNGQATPDNLTEAVTLEIAIADLLEQETNQLAIAPVPPSAGQQNTGQLYYSAWLRTYLPVENLDARNQGIGVTRRYESVDELESPSGNPSASSGHRTLQSTGGQIDSVTVGELVQVRITVDAPNNLHYFTLEDPIPAGFEVVDPSLLTTPSQTTGPTVQPVTGVTEIEQVGVLVPFVATISSTRSDFYYDNWSQKIIRDEKVALFSQLLPRGSYEYTYLLRATVPGRYNILPTIAYQTYHPEVFGRSDGGLFTVTPAE